MSNTNVFVLWHSREIENGPSEGKLIGIYSSREKAEAAIARKLGYPGFKDFAEGFLIDPIELDSDVWFEGFIVRDTAPAEKE